MSSERSLKGLRPIDLAQAVGVSAQAVRNYEGEGVLPPCGRTDTGHRRYTDVHLAALQAFVAVARAAGRPTAVVVLRRLTSGDLDGALTEIDVVHARLLADRRALDGIAEQLDVAVRDRPAPGGPPLSPIELARRIGVTTTTLRSWEAAGILVPQRSPGTGRRHYLDADVRDAELAHLLRSGGAGLADIAEALAAARARGGPPDLAGVVAGQRARLNARGRALLAAAAAVSAYVSAYVSACVTAGTGTLEPGSDLAPRS